MAGFTWVFVGGLILTIGDLLFKKWVVHGASYVSLLYIGGMVLYLVGLFCLVESFKHEHMAVASALFVVVNIVSLSLVSALVYGEYLTTVQALGLVCATIAIVLLELPART